ncbi:MAG: THUMP domain-containing protein [Bacteroidales bacterium]|jgi:putative N6-adenine-specific DNA methylase|nr:THUMP domain-containing protein [Bacteroidales bacterium]
MRLVAKTLYGLEEVLAAELAVLGAEKIRKLNRAVEFEGSKSLLYKVNYNSRVALSVLLPVAEYNIAGQKDLYNGAVAIDWDRFIDPSKTYAVSAVVNSKHFNHSGYAGLVIKDAIADFFRRLTQKRPSVDQGAPDMLVNVHISNDRVTLSVDSTVIPLYKRGYRREQSEAPLSEVLAAGMIMLSGWKAEVPLADGMCGSATIPVEAGLIACNIAPGSFRKGFGFMTWNDYDSALFRSVRFEAEKRERRSPVKIYASDISAEAIRISKLNIAGAKLGETIDISEGDFITKPSPVAEGMLIINPPYGKRLAGEEMDKFYGEIGSALKHHYTGYRAWILSGDIVSLKSVALKPYRKFDLLNGDIECRFQGYELYPGSRKSIIAHTH